MQSRRPQHGSGSPRAAKCVSPGWGNLVGGFVAIGLLENCPAGSCCQRRIPLLPIWNSFSVKNQGTQPCTLRNYTRGVHHQRVTRKPEFLWYRALETQSSSPSRRLLFSRAEFVGYFSFHKPLSGARPKQKLGHDRHQTSHECDASWKERNIGLSAAPKRGPCAAKHV